MSEMNKEQQGALVPDQLHSFGMRVGACGYQTLHSREKNSHLLQKRPSLQKTASMLILLPRKPTQMARLGVSLKDA